MSDQEDGEISDEGEIPRSLTTTEAKNDSNGDKSREDESSVRQDKIDPVEDKLVDRLVSKVNPNDADDLSASKEVSDRVIEKWGTDDTMDCLGDDDHGLYDDLDLRLDNDSPEFPINDLYNFGKDCTEAVETVKGTPRIISDENSQDGLFDEIFCPQVPEVKMKN